MQDYERENKKKILEALWMSFFLHFASKQWLMYFYITVADEFFFKFC